MSSSLTKNPHVIFVSGVSNSGKTTLIERLIPKLQESGLRVGTIKHAHHGYDLDERGKDSWRHREAGASRVALIAPQQGLPLSEAVEEMASSVDLILAEGFKRIEGRKILIEPNGSSRLTLSQAICRIGVFPGDLSPDELDRIVQFCRGSNGSC